MLIPLHGIGSRHDLPLPFSFVVAGAAVALVISFAVLFLAWRSPRLIDPGGRPLPRLTAVVDRPVTVWAGRALMLAVFAWAALALIAGQDRLTNPVFGFVYVWVWVGLVPLSLLLGPVWRATNPIRTLHLGLCALARINPEVGLAALPRRLGVWPAALGLFAFGWLELVQPDRVTLGVLRLWVLAWLIVLVLGSVVFGSRWIGQADPFEAYATTVAQLSCWQRVDGQLHLVNPLRGLGSWSPPIGTAGVVAALLGSTAYDSFANTSWWIQTVQSSTASPILWETGGLAIMIAIVFVTFSLAAGWMGRYRAAGARGLPTAMAGSVVPIVVGYAVAHYFTLLVLEGQRTAIEWSDPLGRGWNVFGSAGMGVNSALFSYPTAIALVQLVAIVGGHVLGIVIAHDKALQLVGGRHALAAQLPMLVVMVGYTCGGLLLLFSP